MSSHNYKHQLQAIHMNYTWVSDMTEKHVLQPFALSQKDGMKFPWTSVVVMGST
jgi:hypothetical protein